MKPHQMPRSFPETLHLSDAPPPKSYAFQKSQIPRINKNFIFIPNPDIVSWQFPPVKHIIKNSPEDLILHFSYISIYKSIHFLQRYGLAMS